MKISQRKIIGIVIAMLFIGVSVAGVAEAAKINLRLQSHLPPDQMHRGFDNFVKDVETMSGGEIKISIFPSMHCPHERDHGQCDQSGG